jgi:hypothetical protein
MTTPSVANSSGAVAAYAACVQAAIDLATPVAQRILGKAGELLLLRAAAAADFQERRLLLEAEQLLGPERERIRNLFPAALQREIDELEQEAAAKARSLSFGALELMGEEQVDETVEVLRAQQMVLSAVEADIGHLNALVCAAKGLETVTAAANPLRPEAWVHALRATCEQCRAPTWARVRWVSHLSEALGPELASVYRQLCELLTRHGVSGAAFAVTAPLRPAGAAGGGQPVGGRMPAEAAPLLNLRDLRRLLKDPLPTRVSSPAAAPTWAATEPAASDTTAGLTVPYAFDALQQMTGMDEVMQRMASRRSAGNLGGGPEASMTPAQALGQEVVRVMVDKIAEDSRVLPQVRQCVRQLEPALVRLARNDPRFFRDQQHPTRRFLTEMTERSLAWTAPDLPGFAEFFEPLRQTVLALAGLPMEDAEPFEFALQSLTEAWDQQEDRGRRERAHAARALVKAERRNLLARRIGERLRQRPDVQAAAPDIRRFLTGPWAQVMAAAQMADPSGSTDPGGYTAVVDDLLWSTRAGFEPAGLPRLAKLIPGLLAALRGGLASIEYPEDKTRHFLHLLADLHRGALRSDGARSEPTRAREAGSAAAHDDSDESDFWMEPTEARASSLMEIAPMANPPGLGDAVQVRTASVRASPLPLAITRLQAGAWIDLYLDGAWSRWRLAWASPQSLLFMFADGSGRYKSMTRSVLETLNRIGALRFVSAETIVQGALDAVAQTALHNSTRSAQFS